MTTSTLLSLARSSRAFLVAASFFLSLVTTCFAQTASTGTIEGRVQNVVTGRFLKNARVTVKQTDLLALTDESGNYRLVRVPSGPAVLDAFYTGLDIQEIAINVPPGGTVTQDVSLTNVAIFGTQDRTVRLDPFTVAASKETDNAQIAINDQRFAPNIKNVVSTDAHGEVMGGNLGEFLKWVPGLDTGGGQFEPDGISVRGVPPAMTQVQSDGAPMANSGPDRGLTLQQISINNISRVEVTKVPTPATPADSVSGSVNLVSKSAFERVGREFRYNVNLTASRRFLTLKKQPRADETYTSFVKPSANLDIILPMTKNVGVTISLLHYMGDVPYNAPNLTFAATTAGAGASFSKPFLLNMLNQITTQFRTRDSVSTKIDWRVTPNSVLSASYQWTYFNLDSMNYNFAGSVGSPIPTIAGGTPFSFGPDFVIGATGRGSLGQSEGFNTQHNIMSLGVLSYRFDNGDWHVDALVTGSTARQWTTREGEGYFGGFSTAVKVPVRLSYLDINEMGPGTVEAYTNTNQRFDIYDINNYNVTAVSGGRLDRRETMKAGNLNVKRRLGFLPFPAALQVGWAGREQTRDSQTYTRNYTYNGINGDFSAKTFEAVVYRNIHEEQMTGIERNPPPGKGAPYASPHLAYRAYLGNPNLFTTTAAQAVTMEQGRRANSLYIEEGVDALYAQGEMRLFKNRLNILGGVRYERTTNFGKGLLNNPNAVWMRNPDGSFARNAAGARIRRTEAGAAGSLDELNLTQTERGYTASRSFDGYYPSLHFTYNISDNLVARAAYAATYGRPNYANIVPNTVINETDFGGGVPDPNVVKGTLTVRNTGLRPWTADNYDLSLEYYTNSGGLFGAGVFDKEIKDFFGTLSKVATAADVAELGLEPSFVGWQVNTQINTGDAQVSGVEVSANQSLHILGRWGKPFKVFANVTKIKVKGAAEGDFSGFLPQVINYGVTFSKSGLIVMAKWNQRSDVAQGLQAYLGPDARAHIKGRTILDMNISYQIWKGTSLFFNARNLTNERVDYLRYGSQTPAYASVFQARSYGGATFDAGVKGSF